MYTNGVIQIKNVNFDAKIKDCVFKSSYNTGYNGIGKIMCKDAIKNVLKRGFRYLDLVIDTDTKNNAIVTYTNQQNIPVKQDEPLFLSETLRTIITYAFGNEAPNPNDPIFLNLRIFSNDITIYNDLSKIIQYNISNRLYSNTVDPNTMLSEIMGKIIIIVDKSLSSNYKTYNNCGSSKLVFENFETSYTNNINDISNASQNMNTDLAYNMFSDISNASQNMNTDLAYNMFSDISNASQNMSTDLTYNMFSDISNASQNMSTDLAYNMFSDISNAKQNVRKDVTPNNLYNILPDLSGIYHTPYNKVIDNKETCVSFSQIVNMESNSEKCAVYKYSNFINQSTNPPLINDDDTTNTPNLKIVVPDKYLNNSFNSLITDYGVQFQPMHVYISDANLTKYENMFNTIGFAICKISSIISLSK
jgi:hypothetical protein